MKITWIILLAMLTAVNTIQAQAKPNQNPAIIKKMIAKCDRGGIGYCYQLESYIYNNPDTLNKLALYYADNGNRPDLVLSLRLSDKSCKLGNHLGCDLAKKIRKKINPKQEINSKQDKSQKGINVLFYKEIMRLISKNESNFRYIFCQHSHSFSRILPRTECQYRMRDYPGSQVNCYDCGGSWVSSTEGHIIYYVPPDGRAVRETINNGAWTTEISYSDNLTSFVIRDMSSNYIAFNFWDNPDKGHYQIVDAHLPDVVTSAIEVFRIKSLSLEIKHNALIKLLNNGYRRYKKMNIEDFSIYMLTNLQFRRNFLEHASQFRR